MVSLSFTYGTKVIVKLSSAGWKQAMVNGMSSPSCFPTTRIVQCSQMIGISMVPRVPTHDSEVIPSLYLQDFGMQVN